MESLFPTVVVLLTSVGGYLVSTRWLRLSVSALLRGVDKTLECLGVCTVFLLVNVIVGVVVTVVTRTLSGQFLSLYLATGLVFLPLSFLQGLAFWCWRRASA